MAVGIYSKQGYAGGKHYSKSEYAGSICISPEVVSVGALVGVLVGTAWHCATSHVSTHTGVLVYSYWHAGLHILAY